MSLAERLFLVVLAVLVVLGLGYWLSPLLVNDLARELWFLPEQAWTIGEERERERDLDALREVISQKTRAKERIMAEVIGGRLSLAEAAKCMRDHDLQQPGFCVKVFHSNRPGSSDEERYCRYVICWARIILENQPDQGRKLLRRLEAELEDIIGRQTPTDPLTLPSLPGGEGRVRG
jgi:hypothetical protein